MSDSVGSFVQQLTRPEVVNPLAAVQAGNAAAKGYYDVQQQRAVQALGAAYQGATDPATGVFDPNKFRALAAGDPRTAMAIGAGYKNVQEISSDELTQRFKKLDAWRAEAGSLASLDNPTHADVMAGLQRLVAGGVMTLPEAQAALGTVPNDPAGIKQWAQTHNLALTDASTRLGATITQTGPGGTTIGAKINPRTAAVQPPAGGQSGLPQGVGPGTMVDVTVNDAQGRPVKTQLPWNRIYGPGGVLAGQGGAAGGGAAQPPAAGGGAPPPPPPGTTITTPGAATGAGSGASGGNAAPQPGAGGNDGGGGGWDAAGRGRSGAAMPGAAAQNAQSQPPAAQPAKTAAATAPGSPVVNTGIGPVLPTGSAPGVAQSLEEQGTANAKQGVALTARADQVPANKANYANMLVDLEKIGTTAPGKDRESAINAFVQRWTGHGLTMSREQVAAADSFKKLANIAVGQQLQAIGGTDARQALFMGSNPNLDLSTLGNQQILHMLQGNEDAIQAKGRAWQAWLKAGNTPDTYGQFQDDFNFHFDPRVFQQQYMGPSEIASLRKSMGPGEARKFQEDVTYARDHGWIK